MPTRTDKNPPWRLQVFVFCILVLILGNLAPITGAGISVYRRSIAPALGIHCAYAHATGGESCSAFAKRILAEYGYFKGLSSCVRRFHACSNTGPGHTGKAVNADHMDHIDACTTSGPAACSRKGLLP